MIDADKGGKRVIILILAHLLFTFWVWLILNAHSVFLLSLLLLFI